MDVSPRQMISVAATLIRFLEHDDAKRTLMGANMQRQAVPLIHPAAPYVGTAWSAAPRSTRARSRLPSTTARSCSPTPRRYIKTSAGLEEYRLPKYQRSNQSTCINHRPLVRVGDTVAAGEPIADGPSTHHGELALGQNLTVAYMSWEGYNYEDAIVVFERVVAEDLLTTIRHLASRDRRARHQARPRGDHPRGAEPLRGHAREPRR